MPVTTAHGLVSNTLTSLVTDRHGDVWVGSPDGLQHVRGTNPKTWKRYALPVEVRTLAAGKDRLWVGTSDGIGTFHDGRYTALALPPRANVRQVLAMEGASDGSLWFCHLDSASPLHWIEGKLLVENYRKVECNRPENQQVVGMDCLAGATKIVMDHLGNELAIPGGPLNTVDKTQTIHRIRNLADWSSPAVSMHVYSRPIDSCVVFDMDAQMCYRRDLKYDNE